MIRKSIALALLVGVAVGAWVVFTGRQQTFNVGYVACLSGRNAELGLEGLKGVQLALEEYNLANRNSGYQVKLTVADNQGESQSAWHAVDTLIDADVDVIIGHMLSEMSATTMQRVEDAGIVMLSPTTSSSSLSGRDDHFLRIYPDVKTVGGKIADYAHHMRKLEKMAVVFDRSNAAFSQELSKQFRDRSEALGSEVVLMLPFNGQQVEMAYSKMVEQVAQSGANGLLIVANPMDTAMICQQVAKQKLQLELFASEWSHSPQLHQLSGQTTDDLVMFQTVIEDDMSPGFAEFSSRFSKQFGNPPWFGSIHGYDAARMALAALERNPDRAELKETLLGYGTFHGVQSLIKLDPYGDVERTQYVEKVSQVKSTLLAML